MICVPIVAKSVEEALKEMKNSVKVADIIELRLDFIKNINENGLKKLLKNRELPIIVTNRGKKKGGEFKGSEKKRLALLKKAIELKADFVDIELNCKEKDEILKNKGKTKIILSWHDFEKTDRKKVNEIFNKMKKTGADIIKIVTTAKNLNDNLVAFDLIKNAKKENKKIITMCMGEYGEISRILCPIFGSFLTFGSSKIGKESAPGQIPAEILKNVYRINELKGKNPKIFGLAGNPVKESKGFLIHNAAFKKSGMNNVYVNFLTDDVGRFINGFKKIVSGLSITMPHKQEIMKNIDKIDARAKKIGAVNTVVKKNNKLFGFNTDCDGAIEAIEAKTKIAGKKVVLLGAGGVARAIAFGINEKKGKLIILNRTIKKAEKLAKEIGCEFGNLDKINEIKPEILINCTSIGMFPDINRSPVNKKLLKKMVVFDTIYNPENTKLLKAAAKNGCKTISGVEMFINQARQQFKLWTGKEINTEIMRKAL